MRRFRRRSASRAIGSVPRRPSRSMAPSLTSRCVGMAISTRRQHRCVASYRWTSMRVTGHRSAPATPSSPMLKRGYPAFDPAGFTLRTKRLPGRCCRSGFASCRPPHCAGASSIGTARVVRSLRPPPYERSTSICPAARRSICTQWPMLRSTAPSTGRRCEPWIPSRQSRPCARSRASPLRRRARRGPRQQRARCTAAQRAPTRSRSRRALWIVGLPRGGCQHVATVPFVGGRAPARAA
jgi:hypothetical protein